nr:BT4734/BF3469 family protein [Mucilaginibacter sp. BT774]
MISKYSHFSGKHPFECNLLEYLNDCSLESTILKIRSKKNKDERDKLKAELPGITPSAICFPSRSAKNVIRRTGLMSFDIDNLHPKRMDSVKLIISTMPYVAYCGLSASGRGYWGLVRISNPAKFDQHFEALQLYFKTFGIDRPYFDIAVKDIARFRYYSVDRNAYFNHSAVVFPYVYEPHISPRKPYDTKTVGSTESNVFDDFNKNGDVESLLICHGWKYQPKYDKGTRKRYTRPGKKEGVSADFCTARRLLYVFTDATNFQPAKGVNPVNVFLQLECNYDWKLCAKKLKDMGFGQP